MGLGWLDFGRTEKHQYETANQLGGEILFICVGVGVGGFWLKWRGWAGVYDFVLTDTNRALFCNNEDWSNPKTRIWFMPASEGRYGVVCVGFDDGYAQGELNTEGLACDWVAGYNEKWNPDPKLPTARRGSSQRMMESCATVEEAIAFYKTHREPGFRRAKILVADRTGASVMIGAKDGKLQVEKARTRAGDLVMGGWRWTRRWRKIPSRQWRWFQDIAGVPARRNYTTKYLNIYDMKTGDILLYPF